MLKKVIIIAVVIIVILFGLMVWRGSEDTWLCTEDGWVKHGSPSAEMPTVACAKECKNYSPENCPTVCVVCPPCPECSSISCQTEEFCASMGIDKNWYEGIKNRISNFKDCAADGNPVMESYPRQCRADGQTFVEDIGNELEKSDLIKVDYPRPNQKIASPLAISGQARGTWFFEATFPVKLVDEQGNVLAQHYATAKSDWMTNEFVEFEATLEFSQIDVERGLLILEKGNPSDLPENDDSLVIPVEF